MALAAALTLGLLVSVQGVRKWQANALARVLDSGDAAVGALSRQDDSPTRDPSDSVLLWEKLAYRKHVDRLSLVSTPTPTQETEPQLFIDLSESGAATQDAPLGMLSIHFCGDRDPRAMFRAVAEGRPISIEIVRERQGESRVVASAIYPIVDDRTLAPTLESALARAELMLVRAITSVAVGGEAGVEAAPDMRAKPEAAAPAWKNKAARFIVRGVTQRLDRLMGPQDYFIAAVPRTGGFADDLGRLAERDDVCITHAPPGYFYADPFPFEHEGQEHLFFETYDRSVGLGRIDWALVRPDGSLGPVETVLTRPYHLSYPFVFRHEGEIYMIPETAKAGQIELWRADAFPLRWSLVGPLIENITATDATLIERDGRFWLFATVAQNGASSWDELHGFSAPSPFGPWTPHPQAPLKMDARSARPAGHFFEEGGKLYRPAQDCSLGYGKGLVVNEVETLDERAFRERPVQRYSPDWMPGNFAFHTLNGSKRFWWIDGKSRRSRLR
jgi:hypothetical protein